MPFGLIGAGVGAVASIFGGGKAARASRRTAGAESAVRRLQTARERGAQIRSAAQALGEQEVAVGGSGVESSSAITGRSTLLNQLSSNLAFINSNEQLGARVDSANQVLRRGRNIQNIGGSAASFLGNI